MTKHVYASINVPSFIMQLLGNPRAPFVAIFRSLIKFVKDLSQQLMGLVPRLWQIYLSMS